MSLGVDSVPLIEGVSLGNSLEVGAPVPLEFGREVGTSDSFREAGLLLGIRLAIVLGRAVGVPRLQVLFTTQTDIKAIGSPLNTEKFPMSALPVLSAPPHFQYVPEVAPFTKTAVNIHPFDLIRN
jgi:hypothetical protein